MNKKVMMYIGIAVALFLLYRWYSSRSNGNGNGNGTTPHTYNGIVQKSNAYCMKKVKGTKGCEEYWSKFVDNKTVTK